MDYCESRYKTVRWKTRVVPVGTVAVGGENPVRIQSMTTSDTRNAEETASQIMRLADVGCEIARVTVQGKKEAEACEQIKNILLQKGYAIPIAADIHFYPPAALLVADFVDKVRINPGNFAEKRASFKEVHFDNAAYEKELERIEEKFAPLVEKCKKLKRALRIGTNHGSLSDRIMTKFGDTPAGMVESALEYTHIARKYDFHNIIFSMKSSNPLVMVHAYRLLVAKMKELGWNYPLHLGVTEAGAGEDGRIKSAIGIGSLLLDGLGDTIRVSLTEDPWLEIDPCQRLVRFAKSCVGKGTTPFEETHRTPFLYKRRIPTFPTSLPFHKDGTVILEASEIPPRAATRPDILFVTDPVLTSPLAKLNYGILSASAHKDYETPILLKDLIQERKSEEQVKRFSIAWRELKPRVVILEEETEEQWQTLLSTPLSCILLRPTGSRLHYSRKFFEYAAQNNLRVPIILAFSYKGEFEDTIIQASAECGALLADGLGDGLFLRGPYPYESLRSLSFNLLQGARMRAIKTEFISCPSCGRTLFNLQDVSERIRKKTHHLPGVKIAIMGCIVNGPGEMADADFGYVGSQPGKVDLYIGKTCVEKGIDHAAADERLIALIKQERRWKDAT